MTSESAALEPYDDQLATQVNSGSSTAPSRVSDIVFERGATIGRYVLLDRLGEGGMGIVYAAYDPELDRKVALKVLRPVANVAADDTTTGGDRSRLLREAQALAKLSHPNVVAVHDVGTSDGDIFMAMAFIEGQTLREWVREADPSWPQIVAVYAQAGEGLAAAHDAGLTHRDFKPDNVLIDAHGRVYVLDFGLVHGHQDAAGSASAEFATFEDFALTSASTDALGSSDDSDMLSGSSRIGPVTGQTDAPRSGMVTRLTQHGSIMGTPAYMSPEQHVGAPTDARSDQFSFCVALHEALYRERPFAGVSAATVRRAVASGRVRAPADSRGVPKWLRRLVLRGLAADPAQRHESMRALLDAMTRDPVVRRRRLIASGLGVLLLAAGAAVYQYGREVPVDRCAGGAERMADVWNGKRRDGIQKAFIDTGITYAGSTVARTVEVVERYAHAWVGMRREACEATVVYGEQSDAMFDLRMRCLDERLGAFDSLLEMYGRPDSRIVDQAVRAAYELPAIDDCANISALAAQVPLPDDVELRGKIDARRDELARIEATAAVAPVHDLERRLAALSVEIAALGYVPLTARAERALARARTDIGRKVEAIAGYERALYASLGVGDHLAAADAALGLLWTDAYALRRLDRADTQINLSRALVQAAGDPPLYAARLEDVLGHLAGDARRTEEEIEHRRRALALRQRELDAGDPQLHQARQSLALALISPDPLKGAEAMRMLEELLADVERHWPREHPQTARIFRALSQAHETTGDIRSAYETALEASRIYAAIGASDSLWARDVERFLGWDLALLGRNREGLERFARVRGFVAADPISCDTGDVFWGVTPLVQMYLNLGEVETAADIAWRASRDCEDQLGVGHPDTMPLAATWADAQIRQGRARDALRTLETLLAAREAKNMPTADWLLDVVGDAQRGVGDFDAAIATHRAALAEVESQVGPKGATHPWHAAATLALCRSLVAAEHYDESIVRLEPAIESFARAFGDDAPSLVEPLVVLAQAHLGRSDAAAASEVLQRAKRLFVADELDPALIEQVDRLIQTAAKARAAASD